MSSAFTRWVCKCGWGFTNVIPCVQVWCPKCRHHATGMMKPMQGVK